MYLSSLGLATLMLGALLGGCAGAQTGAGTPETSASSAPPATSGEAAAGAAAQGGAAAPEKAPAVRSVDLAGFRNDYYAGKVAFLLDVRTDAEFRGGHVPRAVNLPLDQVEARASELAPHLGEEIYVICETGGRSARAAALLAERGYRTVNVQGGTYAWRSDGQPVE